MATRLKDTVRCNCDGSGIVVQTSNRLHCSSAALTGGIPTNEAAFNKTVVFCGELSACDGGAEYEKCPSLWRGRAVDRYATSVQPIEEANLLGSLVCLLR